MSGAKLAAEAALLIGAGGVSGVVTAKITTRSQERIAGKSKPHEVTTAHAVDAEATTHAFVAFMVEARFELERLKAEAVEGRHERDELRRVASVLADQLRACEDKHAESAMEIHELHRQLDELRTQTGNDPQETT